MAAIKRRSWTTAAGLARESWRVRYVDKDGVERSRQFDKKRDADAFKIKTESEVTLGVHTPDSQSVTVAEAADQWVAKAVSNGREFGTVKGYKELARLHIKPLIGSERLSRLTMPKVEAYADALAGTRSKAMASKAVRALSSILTEAMRRGMVAQNVARGVKVKRSARDRKRIEIPTKAELRAMLDAAALPSASAGMHAMLMMAIFTGLRSSELRGLRWIDVDLKAGSISVNQRADAWGAVGPPKSEAGFRTIPIGAMLMTAMRRWKLACPKSALGLVFPNEAGRPLWQGNLHTIRYRPIQIAAGLALDSGKLDEDGNPILVAKYGLHSLRHAAASSWIKQGIDLKRLQTWMGHSSIQITLDTYGHLISDAQGDAVLAGGAEAAFMA